MQQQQAVDTRSRRRKTRRRYATPDVTPIFQLVLQKEARNKMQKESATEVAKEDEPFVRSSSVRRIRIQTAENGNHVLSPTLALLLAKGGEAK